MSDVVSATEPITRWFSFGPDHRHEVDGCIIDDSVIVRITAPDPRGVMLVVFGRKWCWEYDEPPEHPLMRDKSVLDVSIAVNDVGGPDHQTAHAVMHKGRTTRNAAGDWSAECKCGWSVRGTTVYEDAYNVAKEHLDGHFTTLRDPTRVSTLEDPAVRP